MRETCDITINTPNFSIRIKKRNTVHARLREMHYVSVDNETTTSNQETHDDT